MKYLVTSWCIRKGAMNGAGVIKNPEPYVKQLRSYPHLG